MKRLLTFFTLIAFLAQTAQAHTASAIKPLLDELNYGLTVEWDQRDPIQRREILDEFSFKLMELKLPTETLMQELRNELADAQLQRSVDEALLLVDERKLSTSEAQQFVLAHVQDTAKRGASWNGRATIISASAVVIIAALAVLTVYSIETVRIGRELQPKVVRRTDYDKNNHCALTCMLTLRRGGANVLLVGILKEVSDIFTDDNAEWSDLRANRIGVGFARRGQAATDEQCFSACDSVYPPR